MFGNGGHQADTGGVIGPPVVVFSAVVPFVPAALYLWMVWMVLCGFARVPAWLHPFFLVFGLGFRLTLTEASAGQVLVPLAVAVFVFVVLVAVAARTVSGVSLFTICVGLALTPVGGWPGLVLGLGVAGSGGSRADVAHDGQGAGVVLGQRHPVGAGHLARGWVQAATTGAHSDASHVDG